MGVPPPTTHLVVPPPKAPAQTATGIVNEVATGIDGVRRAYVNVNGSTFACVVPGSVLGVMADKTVQISIQGNSRTVLAVTTPLDPPNYTGTPDSIERGSTAAPPSTPSLYSIDAFHSTVTTISDANIELSIVSGLMVEIGSNFDDLISCVGDLISSVEELRNKVDTMQQDLQDGTGIFK